MLFVYVPSVNGRGVLQLSQPLVQDYVGLHELRDDGVRTPASISLLFQTTLYGSDSVAQLVC